MIYGGTGIKDYKIIFIKSLRKIIDKVFKILYNNNVKINKDLYLQEERSPMIVVGGIQYTYLPGPPLRYLYGGC